MRETLAPFDTLIAVTPTVTDPSAPQGGGRPRPFPGEAFLVRLIMSRFEHCSTCHIS